MASIIIRRLDREAAEPLRLRAVRSRHPLESGTRGILERVARAVDGPDITPRPGEPLAGDPIRRDRGHGHRAL